MAYNKGKIGKRIRDYRILKGLTQENLAELADTSLSAISRLENGRLMVSVEKLIDIARVLDITVDYLLVDFITEKKSKSNCIHEIIFFLEKLSAEEQEYWKENLLLYMKYKK